MVVSRSVTWLYEDNHLLALCKPAGLLSQADRTGDADVVSLARAYLKAKYEKPGNVYIGLVHRLDRPVSGAMVLARTSKAARRLNDLFSERRVRKKYLAAVEGRLSGNGVMKDAIFKDSSTGRVRVDPVNGKHAILNYHTLGHIADHTIVGVELITGRPHQIRCQFAHRGLPLVGDFRYGANCEFDGKNLALHCVELGFQHPIRQKPTRIRAEYPSAWAMYAPIAVGW